MFSQAELNQAVIKGRYEDPSAIQLVNAVKNNNQRIRNYLESIQTSVGSGHLVLKILAAIGYAGEPTYEEIEWACRRKLSDIGNALRLTSVGEYGQVFNGAFIEGQDEIISLVARPVDPNLSFRDYTPVVYLYHEYTNLNWTLGNGKPRGISIIEINLVALLWQYVLAEQYYRTQPEPITRLVYAQRHIIYRMLPSYMDIAFLNIHRAIAFGKEIEEENPLRVIPTPPLRDLAIRHAKAISKSLRVGKPLPAVVMAHIPQIFEDPNKPSTALDRILFKEPGSTIQGSWHRNIVNWYWALFCLQYDNASMGKYKSNLMVRIARFEDAKILEKLTRSARNYYRHELILPLYSALEK